MNARRQGTSQDADLNPDLAEELSSLRGGMAGAAERVEVPDRFTFEPHPDRAAMILTDTETGKTTTVALCGYSDVRKALADLF